MIVKCQSKQAFWNQLPTTIKVTVCRRSLYTLWSHTTGLDCGQIESNNNNIWNNNNCLSWFYSEKSYAILRRSPPPPSFAFSMKWAEHRMELQPISSVSSSSYQQMIIVPSLCYYRFYEHLSIRRALHLVGISIYSTNNKPSSRSTYYT